MSERYLIKVGKLHKSGHSVVLYIPKKALEMTKLKAGDEVLIYVGSDGSILLKPQKGSIRGEMY